VLAKGENVLPKNCFGSSIDVKKNQAVGKTCHPVK